MNLEIPWVSDEEWNARMSLDRDPVEALRDPVYRIGSLYEIKDEEGRMRPFIPTPEQRVIIYDICVRGYKNIIIPKARKLGMSTVIGIICADKLVWEAGVEIALVDRTKNDAVDKLDRIVRFAIDHLDPRFGARAATNADRTDEIWVNTGGKNDLTSKFSAGVSFRGGTPTFLHVSEWGAIQFDEPARSEEIKTGAMEAARHGTRVIETTWKGGADGHVWTYVEEALEIPENEKTERDWRIRFFPWWLGRKNVRDGKVERIDAETNKYLDDRESELGIKFAPTQRLWYYHQRRELGIFIKRENPTTLEECWSTPVEGAIYADLIEKMKVNGAITKVEPNEGMAVDTFWDLGSPQNTVVWYVQNLGGGKYDIIDCDGGLDLTTDERVVHMGRKGYVYGAHYVPHDAAAAQRGGLTYQEELMRAGLENVRVVGRTTDIELGINALRRILPNCRFDAVKCKKGIDALNAYHAKMEVGGKHRSENIVHDWASHFCDALRVMAEADSVGMLSHQGGKRFDAEGVKVLDVKAGNHAVKTGTIAVQDYGAVFLEAAEAESWLAMVSRPVVERCYIVAYAAMRMRHVWAVLRAEFNPEMEVTGALVCAASTGDTLMDADIAAQRVAATAQYFGGCLVVTVSDAPESTWRSLVAHGCDRVFRRPKSILTKSQQQIGWPSNDEMAEPMANLARRIREEQLDVFHAPIRNQLGQFMRQPGGKAGAMVGYGDEWVRAMAAGCQCLPMGTPFHPMGQRKIQPQTLMVGEMFGGRPNSF